MSDSARRRVDRIAAIVGAVTFGVGLVGIIATNAAPAGPPAALSTTVVSSPIPGPATTSTLQRTSPPTRPTAEPRVTQEVTVTEGVSEGSVVVTTSPAPPTEPFLGSIVASIAFQLILVALAALLLAFGTQRLLLGTPIGRRENSVAPIEEAEALAVTKNLQAATEAPDLSRPLFARGSVPDARLRLLESRIDLELDVRRLAQNHDLPSGLTIPSVVRGLVEKKKMSPKLAAAVTDLHDIGDRLSRGAEISLDTTTMLTEAYAQALARVGGKAKARRA